MSEKERIANSVNERASILAYFIATVLAEGDVDYANEELGDERESYSKGSGGAGITLTKLQAVGLIDNLAQETLNTFDETEMDKAINTLVTNLPESIVEKL